MMTDEDGKQFFYDPDQQTTYPRYKAKAEVFESYLKTQSLPWDFLGQNSPGWCRGNEFFCGYNRPHGPKTLNQ